MKFFPILAAVAVTTLTFAAALPAHADEYGSRGRYERRGDDGWRGERREHEWREHEWRERQAYRAPYIYSQPYGYYPRPVYVPPPPVYYAPPPAYYAPPPAYYGVSPGVSFGFRLR